MTQFEYLAIAFSLLYSLAALRIIGGWSRAIRAESRSLRFIGLTFVQLLLVAVSFWVFWGLSEVEWTFIGFLVALLIPGGLYFCSTVLMPEEPDEVESWREHYVAVRGTWFFGIAVWGMSAAASATLNLGMGLVHPARGVHVTALVMGLVGGTVKNERVHTGLVVILLVICLVVIVGQVPAYFLAAG